MLDINKSKALLKSIERITKPILAYIDDFMMAYVTYWALLIISIVLLVDMEKMLADVGWVGDLCCILYAITIVYWVLKLRLWRFKKIKEQADKLKADRVNKSENLNEVIKRRIQWLKSSLH